MFDDQTTLPAVLLSLMYVKDHDDDDDDWWKLQEMSSVVEVVGLCS